jgi:hypothetical protein
LGEWDTIELKNEHYLFVKKLHKFEFHEILEDGWEDLKIHFMRAAAEYCYNSLHKWKEDQQHSLDLPDHCFQGIKKAIDLLKYEGLKDIPPENLPDYVLQVIDLLDEHRISFTPSKSTESNEQPLTKLVGCLMRAIKIGYDSQQPPSRLDAPLFPLSNISTADILLLLRAHFFLVKADYQNLYTSYGTNYLSTEEDNLSTIPKIGTNTYQTSHLFKQIITKLAEVHGADVTRFTTQLTVGLTHSSLYNMLSRPSLLHFLGERLGEQLKLAVIEETKERVFSRVSFFPQLIYSGWSVPETPGHAMWSIVYKRANDFFVSSINTGYGINQHDKIPSSKGRGYKYSLSKTSPKLNKEKLNSYLDRILPLADKSSSMRVKSTDKIQKYIYKPLEGGTEANPVYIRPQSSTNCTTESQKRLFKLMNPNEYKELQIGISFAAYMMGISSLVDLESKISIKGAITRVIAREIFRSLQPHKSSAELLDIANVWQENVESSVSYYMMQKIFHKSMHSNHYEMNLQCLQTLLNHQSTRARQCLAEAFKRVINSDSQQTEEVELALDGLQLALTHNVGDSKLFFKALSKRVPDLAAFPWASAKENRFQLLRSFKKKIKSASPLSEELDRSLGAVLGSSPSKRPLPQNSGQPQKRRKAY